MAGGMLTGPRWTDGHQSPGVLGLSQGARIVAKRLGRGFGEGQDTLGSGRREDLAALVSG